MGFLSHLDDQSDITDIILKNTRRYRGLNDFTQILLRGPSELSIQERELLAAYVSSINACSFCAGVHTAVAVNFGMKEELIDLLVKDIESAPIADKLKYILKFAKKLTQNSSRIVQEDVDQIVQAGWSEDTVEDVIGITGLFNFYNRLLDGHGIKGTNLIYKEGAKHLSKRGYRFPAIVAFFFKLFWKKKKAPAMANV